MNFLLPSGLQFRDVFSIVGRIGNEKNEGFQNFSKLLQYKGILGLTLILS